ncbi:hypothetical protein M9H77_34349 [Catharanthus roseus]|uniref:Uncharacterized protein n=1 Tax=Catharanthus roseus TaxID=4058 RepID=A0ACB9ZMM5_CATRO|nr:hypothetical protein M9H77_34349 [Catharanthus roseus]
MILIQMVISEPPLESPLEPETNPVIPNPSSSTPIPSSILETPDPILEGFDEEAEHPKAQAQALRDYQLARDRVRRVPKEYPRPFLPYDELDLSWRRGAHLTRSRNTGSDWAWPPGLPVGVSPI